MRKLVWVACIACSCSMAMASGIYVRGGLGWDHSMLDSSGFNTAGSFDNTGGDTDITGFFDFGAGYQFGHIRVGADFSQHGGTTYTTNSCCPPFIDFFYGTQVHTATYLVSGEWEFRKDGTWNPFIGLDAGVSQIRISTDDTVVHGKNTDYQTTVGAHAGVSLTISKASSLEFSYRYLNPKEIEVDLFEANLPVLPAQVGVKAPVPNEIPAGNYKADLASSQLILGWRWSLH